MGGLLFCAPTLITIVTLGVVYGTTKCAVIGGNWYVVETCGMTGKGAKTCWDFTNSFVTWFPPILSLLSSCLLRGAVKKTHGIKENLAEDAVCALLCPLCVLCQEKREVDIRPPAMTPASAPQQQQVQMQTAQTMQQPSGKQGAPSGYGAPSGGAPQGYGAMPMGYGAMPGGAPQGYGAGAMPGGAPQGYGAQPMAPMGGVPMYR